MEEPYLHRVVGLYPTHAAAQIAREELLAHGVPPSQLRLIAPELTNAADAVAEAAAPDSDEVVAELLRDGAIGTAVGSAAGAGATIALAAANITLFVTNPVFGALFLLGWGASLGGLLGAVVGAERHQGDVASLIKDAMACSQFVLVVHAKTEEQTSQAQRIFGKFMASEEGTLALED